MHGIVISASRGVGRKVSETILHADRNAVTPERIRSHYDMWVAAAERQGLPASFVRGLHNFVRYLETIGYDRLETMQTIRI